MAARLPIHFPLNDARRQKARLATSLSGPERELMNLLAEGVMRVFGSERSDDVLLTTPSRAPRRSVRFREEEESQVLRPLGAAARSLLRAGWVRFHPGPDGENGYFFLTESAEKVCRALEEGLG